MPLPVGDLDPRLIHGSLGPHESACKRHIDRTGSAVFAQNFIQYDQHRQTDHVTCDICSNTLYVCTACMQHGLIILRQYLYVWYFVYNVSVVIFCRLYHCFLVVLQCEINK